MEKPTVIDLNIHESTEFITAKNKLEKKIGEKLSNNKAIELLSKIYNAGGHSTTRVFNMIKSTMRYEPDICPVCKKEFFPSTKSKKTCGKICRNTLYARKKNGLLPTSLTEPTSTNF